MSRFLVFVFLFVISLHGQISAEKTGKVMTEIPHPPITLSTLGPDTTTQNPNTTTTMKPNTTTVVPTTPPTTVPPTTKPTTPITTTTTKPTTTTTTTTTTISPPTTSTTAKPNPTTPPPPPPQPSDRKFDAFSFLGGFCLALGLVAIVILAWKFYVSRQENVYHTL